MLPRVHGWSAAVPLVLIACGAASSYLSSSPPIGIAAASTAAPAQYSRREPARSGTLSDHPQKLGEHDASCPTGMTLIDSSSGPYCIDRWEAAIEHILPGGEREPWPGNRAVDGLEKEIVAVSAAGNKPQGYISGEQALMACERAGKRLCEKREWLAACRGPENTRYPYGNQRRSHVCNDQERSTAEHPVDELFLQFKKADEPTKAKWSPLWMNDSRLHELPNTVAPSGAFEDCTNDYGVYDMVGNLHEWISERGGTFVGGYFMDTYQHGEGCDYKTTAHSFTYHDYSTGFRCCADPDAGG